MASWRSKGVDSERRTSNLISMRERPARVTDGGSNGAAAALLTTASAAPASVNALIRLHELTHMLLKVQLMQSRAPERRRKGCGAYAVTQQTAVQVSTAFSARLCAQLCCHQRSTPFRPIGKHTCY